MSDSFDEFQPVNNEWDEFAVAPGSGPSNKDVARAVVPANPDHAAAAAKLAKKYNAPDEVLLRNLQDVQVQDAVNEYSKKLAAAPVLADYMRKSPFVAKQSHDDIDALTQVGQFFTDTAGSVKAGAFNASRGAAGVFRAGFEFVAPALDVLEPVTAIGGNPLRRLAEGFDMQAQAAGATAKAATPKVDGILASGFQSGIQSLTQNTLALPLAFAPGGQGAALSMMTASTGGNAYQDARDKGLSMSQALPFAASQAAIEWATERIPLLNLVGDVKAGTPILQTLMRQVAAEVPGEQVATILQDLNEWAVLNPTKPFSSYLEERPSAAAQTLVATLVGVGGNVAISKGIETAITRATRTGEDMQTAEGDAQRLTAAMQAATASKLRERNPETFAQLVQHIAQNTDGAPQSVYIDAQVLNQSGLDIAAVLPGVAAQMEAALATNGTVEVPISEALANLPGTPLEQVFLQNARSAPDALSLADVEQQGAQAAEFIKQEADRVLQQAQDQSAWQASTDAVRTTILDQLNQVGRFTPEVNEAYATLQMNFFSTMAARTGITPQEMYDRFSLKVAAGSQAKASQVLNAGAKPGEITVEGYHFSKAPRTTLVGDAFGRGLVGTHRDQFMEAADQRLRKRIYFYADIGRGINPEDGVGGFGHKANLTNIYDVDADPLRLKTGRNYLALESAILDAGYDGYLSRESGHVIVLGDKAVQVDQIPTGGHKTGTTVVPPPERTEARGRDKTIETVRGLQGLPIGQIDLEMWSNTLARKAPEAHAEMAAAGVFDGPGEFYKDELVRRFIDRTEAPVYNQTATVRRGAETLKKYGLKPGNKYKTREVAAALEARQRERYGTIEADDRSPEAVAKIAKWMQAEVEFAMDNPESSGVGWYSEKFQRALDTMAQQFPELATDKVARDTMTALIAITSDGQKVVPNFAQAMDIYGNFKATGKFTTTRGHQRQASVDGNMAVIQRLHDQMGAEAMHAYLMQEKTISELKKLAKANGGDLKSDYQAHIKMPMAAVEFGPKLGAFYANLMGAHGYLTMDRWWSRSFNRYRGTLLQAPTRQGLDRFKELLGTPAMSDDEAIAATVEPRNAYEAKGFKSGTELEKAANTIYKAAFEKLEDAPFNATDRTFMLDAVNKAQKSLARKGYNLSVADIQAILWYYEKRLYGELGARQTADISYEEAAQRVVAGYAGGQGVESLLDDTGAAPEDGGADSGRVPAGEETYTQGDLTDGRPEQTGDRGGRYSSGSLAPLEGAPAVAGAAGPDPQLVSVAEQYARDNGINLRRQDRFVEVDEARAARIAQAYAEMRHAPNDPQVKEAYDDLIRQVRAQYDALTAAGYQFTFFDENSDPYSGNPWNAMRDLRANQRMAVYGTYAGFGVGAQVNIGLADPKGGDNLDPAAVLQALLDVGAEVEVSSVHSSDTEPTLVVKIKQALTKEQGDRVSEVLGQEAIAQRTDDEQGQLFGPMAEQWGPYNPSYFVTIAGDRADTIANPMLQDTGLRWPDQNGETHPVLANDLFRAVHDTFGHGIEGAGFRARGEENAWQAHARLFTGPALGALTSETRGQNSWLNYGPYGEANRNAAVEDTVFAEQKNGLMPEWTWTEGRAGDMQDDGVLNQDGPLLAPNGKPSNLDVKLHAMVRTPEFKAWFGDWENDPANASKAVDENGEPKVYYHGSENAGFTEFDVDGKGKGKTRGTGAFFADTFNMAKGYSGSRDDAPIYTPEQIFADPDVIDGLEIEEGVLVEVTVSSRGDKAWQWYANEEEALADLELEPGEDLGAKPGYRMTDPNGYETKGTKEEILAELEGMTTEAPGVYEVFLNVRDLVTIDWQGNNWDDGPKEKAWNILDENGDIYETAYSQEEADAALERNPGFTAEEDEQSPYDSTDDAARQGRDMGADGVLIKDVNDTGPRGYAEDGDVLIVYKPENIKEVRNQGTFDPQNPNILKQGPRGTFNPQTLLISLNENANLSTFLHESGHFFLEVMADIASQPDAPAQITDDMGNLLKWFGVPDIATWNSYTLDQKRPHHERFAESFEAYLLEGKAPSAELQPLFRKFRSWLVNVYKSLSEFMRGRNLDISPEIRQVFDRMLATDEQIRQAEDTAGMLPDFDATNEAIEKLQARSLRDLKWTIGARSKALKALQKEAANLRKAVEAEVRAEVEATPEMRAKAALGDLRKTNKRAPTDMEIATVADAFGYPTVDAMLQAIDAYGPKKAAIEGMTDQRMLENFGELATPEAIEAAANDAVHNEARARSLATELKGQADALNPREDTGRTASNGRSITVNALTAAAKQFAQNLTARRRVKDLKNAAWQHRSAESRAAKAWQEATAKGKTEEAVAAKRDQLLNNYTAKAMGEAQAEVRKVLEFFAKVTKGNNEKLIDKGRDPDVVNAARAVLAAYDIAPRLEKSANDYMEAVAKYDAQMYGALKPGLDAMLANAKPFGELTVDEMRALRDEIGSMWELAKTSRQMEIDGDRVDIDDAAQDLVNRMVEIGVPDEIPGEKGAITNRQELDIKLQFAKAILSRVEQWAERMDGKFGGPFLRYVFQPVKDAADRYRTARVQHREKFTKLVEGVAPFIKPGPIAAPELGYTFGNARDSGMAELLHALIHTGNDSNKRKLLLGGRPNNPWATENADGTLDTTRWDAFVARLISEGTLRKEHYDFAQGVWDLLEETKPLAQEAHRKVFGRYFAEVTANEFTTPFGVYRGGYAPAQTDSRLVGDAKLRELAEGENESMAYAFPSAPNGFTKSRVEYNKPLLLDLRALAQHMDKVLLFSHMQPAISDARRLLTRKNVSYALDRIDPGAYEGMLTPWLARSAKQIVETPIAGDRRISRFMGAVRSRAGMALMMANLSNTVQQITGFSTAAIKVKPSLMLKAVGQFTASPKEFKRSVAEASPYMKDRMLNELSSMNDVVEQILVDPTLLEKGQAWTQKHAYFLQSAVDNTMSPIIWTAAYNQAIEEGSEARDAVRFADGVIRQTQGSTLPEDVSRFETGDARARFFTQFIGYFNMMANTNATAVSQVANEMGLRKGAGKLLYIALVGLLVPIWVAEAIAQAFRGGPGDEDDDGYLDDWLMAVFGLGTIRGLTATVPIAGQGAQMVVSRFNNNPADDKFSLSPAISLIESSFSSPFSVYDAIIEDGNAQKAVRDVAAAATLLTGLPFYAAARPVGYAAGVAQGKIEPTDAVDAVRGTVTGTASKESKTP